MYEMTKAGAQDGGRALMEVLLEEAGHEIVETGWSCEDGEIDIISIDVDGSLVFTEVKASAGADVPDGCMSAEKRRRHERIAMRYLLGSDDVVGCVPVRFDIACIRVWDGGALVRHHVGWPSSLEASR